jgi:Arc/MetJ-type ribon-helix-helix transcriptional regulator
MPKNKADNWQIVSVRFPHELLQRLDRYLDWSDRYRQAKSSRNAAIREALNRWLDDHEQSAGFLEPQAQRQQFQRAYHSLNTHHDWVAIHRLRQLMPWPRERFDTMVEALRADYHVELERADPHTMSPPAFQESYQVHGQFYSRLRWRG